MTHLLLSWLLTAAFSAFPPPPSTVTPVQTVPVSPGAPMPPMSSSAMSGGITVRGSGNVTAQADTAAITLHVFTRNGSQTLDSAALAPIVDALVRAGVARSDITEPIYMNGSVQTTNAAIVALVRNPTIETLQSGMAALASFPANYPVSVSSAEVRLSKSDCSGARQQAERAAIAQARANAESIARNLNVRVGQVLAVDYQTAMPDQSGGCGYAYSLNAYQNMPFSSPAEYLRVRVYSTVTIRYAIK